jgi:hypothetical protein
LSDPGPQPTSPIRLHLEYQVPRAGAHDRRGEPNNGPRTCRSSAQLACCCPRKPKLGYTGISAEDPPLAVPPGALPGSARSAKPCATNTLPKQFREGARVVGSIRRSSGRISSCGWSVPLRRFLAVCHPFLDLVMFFLRWSIVAPGHSEATRRRAAGYKIPSGGECWNSAPLPPPPAQGRPLFSRAADTAPNPVHRSSGRRFCRTDRRDPCGLAATPP